MCSNNDISPHDLQAQSEYLVRMVGVLITPKKVSDCKDEDLDEIMEELESIAFQIRSDPIPEEEIQEKLQSIHEFIMRLAEENKELKGRVTVLEGENKELKGKVTVLQGENKELKGRVTVLQGEVKKLKQELESL